MVARVTYLSSYLLTPWCRVLIERLTGCQLVQKLPAFYGNRMFITHSQVSATCPYPEPDRSSPYSLLKINLNNILPSTSGFPRWSLSPKFSHQNNVYASLRPNTCYMPCPSHSSRFFFTRIIFGEEYRSSSSSLCSFLHSPATSSILGPNILLNTHTILKHPQPKFLP